MSELTEAERRTLFDYTHPGCGHSIKVHNRFACEGEECGCSTGSDFLTICAVTAILSERERAAGERAWQDAIRALAWALANGPDWGQSQVVSDAMVYVAENHPYLRADRGTSAGGGEG